MGYGCRGLRWFTVLLVLPGASALASTLNVTNTATYTANGPCPDMGAGVVCYTTSYLGAAPVNGGDVINNSTSTTGAGIPYPGGDIFRQGFDAWNAANGNAWNLFDGTNDGVDDLGGTLDVTTFTTAAFNNNPYRGGLTIRIDPNNLTGLPALGAGERFVWVQALYDNYLIPGGLTTPFFEMDVSTVTPCTMVGDGTAANPVCPPAYPFQNSASNPNLFYDQPIAQAGAFFAAEAFFGVLDYSNKSLTIYDGVDYGFLNTAPEPATWGLCVAALALLLGRRAGRYPAPRH